MDLGVFEGVGVREMTTADVEYTVKIQFAVLKKQTDVWILLCFHFLEILSYFFFFFIFYFIRSKKQLCSWLIHITVRANE